VRKYPTTLIPKPATKAFNQPKCAQCNTVRAQEVYRKHRANIRNLSPQLRSTRPINKYMGNVKGVKELPVKISIQLLIWILQNPGVNHSKAAPFLLHVFIFNIFIPKGERQVICSNIS
jgi:hypothetical protein